MSCLSADLLAIVPSPDPLITVSIVSHGHGAMVARLTEDVLRFPEIGQVILTLNIPESIILPRDTRLLVLENCTPMGFAANHNAAYRRSDQPYFCPLNPDIQLQGNPFPELLAALEEPSVAIAAPLVVNPLGIVEDSLRRFPTFTLLALKCLGLSDGRYSIERGGKSVLVEWVAGMFLLFRSADFQRLQGFDPHFFLYYEDVDICVRAWKAGMKVVACPSVRVIHDAQRASRRNLRHMRWHLASMVRYFLKHWGRLPKALDRS